MVSSWGDWILMAWPVLLISVDLEMFRFEDGGPEAFSDSFGARCSDTFQEYTCWIVLAANISWVRSPTDGPESEAGKSKNLAAVQTACPVGGARWGSSSKHWFDLAGSGAVSCRLGGKTEHWRPLDAMLLLLGLDHLIETFLWLYCSVQGRNRSQPAFPSAPERSQGPIWRVCRDFLRWNFNIMKNMTEDRSVSVLRTWELRCLWRPARLVVFSVCSFEWNIQSWGCCLKQFQAGNFVHLFVK